MANKSEFPPVSPVTAGLSASCPRCGDGRLFAGFLRLNDRCSVCGLDFGFADSADGPAVFVMTGIGFVIVGLVLAVELLFVPPLWVHAILWMPLVLILGVAPLRPIKALMIAQQYQKNAREGRVENNGRSI